MFTLNKLDQSVNHDFLQVLTKKINNFTQLDSEEITKSLVEVCFGRESFYDYDTVIEMMKEYLNDKSDSQKIGAISELILTYILRSMDYNQEHCFNNLEEGSAKKGFDGLYTKDGEIWVVESKSSSTKERHKYKHKGTIDKGYNGIKSQLAGKSPNNAWANAVNHAKIMGTERSLVKKISELAASHTKKKFINIKNSNVILGTTIIDEDVEKTELSFEAIEYYCGHHESKKEIVVAINLKSIDDILSYIHGGLNE